MNKKTVARVLVGFLTFVMIAVVVVCCFTGCGNRQVFDTTYTFDRAILSLPNGEVIEGRVESWKDFEGDQIQVKIDGKSYLVHSENIVLIDE